VRSRGMGLLSVTVTLILTYGSWSEGAFMNSWRRYPRSDEILARLKSAFPNADRTKIEPDCVGLTASNRGLLGDNNPSDGMPQSEQPEIVFLGWLAKCAKKMIVEEFDRSTNAENYSLRNQISEFLQNEQAADLNSKSKDLLELDWTQMSPDKKNRTLDLVFLQLAGPDQLFDGRCGTSKAIEVKGDLMKALDSILTGRGKTESPIPPKDPEHPTVLEVARLISYLVVMRLDVFFVY
jgi:hypothetical protein